MTPLNNVAPVEHKHHRSTGVICLKDDCKAD